MSKPDTGPTPRDKRRVRVPFNPKERNVTEREYRALKRAGYVKDELAPKQAPPVEEHTTPALSAPAQVPTSGPAATARKRTTTSKNTTDKES